MSTETAAWSNRRPTRSETVNTHTFPAPPAWVEQGLCAQIDSETFFPEKGGSSRPAKRICGMCDVREECLNYALTNGERFGVWGGMSERERRAIEKGAAA